MKKSVITVLLFAILMLSACNVVVESQQEERTEYPTNVEECQSSESREDITIQTQNKDHAARILKVDTDLEKEHVWHFVPEGVDTMTISVEAENVETVLFWIAETGTGTWAERKLIGYDIDGNDGWSITWEFGDRTFLDHITVQALGSDGATQATETINLRSR